MDGLLTISAGHLSPDTWSWLDTHLQEDNLLHPANSVAALLGGGLTRYGWFMACPTEGCEELPRDLWDVLADARRRGASYMVFKRDAILLDDLPIRHPASNDRADESVWSKRSIGSRTEALMPRRKRQSAVDLVEVALQRAGSIGALERMAGVDQAPEARAAFWEEYCRIKPPAAALDAGVAELKRRIRAHAVRTRPS